MTCAFCKTNAYGCTPGRCFSPRSRSDAEKTKAAEPRPVYPSIGPRRLVISAHARSGSSGAIIWVCELECMHIVWRRGIKKAPRTEVCVGCGDPFTAACACGCKQIAELSVRFRRWTWKNGSWFAPGHLEKALQRLRDAGVVVE